MLHRKGTLPAMKTTISTETKKKSESFFPPSFSSISDLSVHSSILVFLCSMSLMPAMKTMTSIETKPLSEDDDLY